MALDYVRLTIDAEIGGSQRTGVFEFGPSEQGAGIVSEGVRTGYLLEDTGQAAIALLARLAPSIESRTKSVRVSGGGQHIFSIESEVPTTGTKPGGSTYQWGSDPDPTVGPNAHTATGADKEAQQAVFMNYVTRSDGDSFSPATLELFENSSSGFNDPIDVALEDPEVSVVNDDPTSADISLTAVAVLDLNQAYTQAKRQG